MNLDVYPIEREGSELVFFFTSLNERRTHAVVKMISYGRLIRHGALYYNLAFGDYYEETDYLDDVSVTDNGDMRKVFRTVISTLEIFFNEHPTERVHIDGSDSTRRAYYLLGVA